MYTFPFECKLKHFFLLKVFVCVCMCVSSLTVVDGKHFAAVHLDEAAQWKLSMSDSKLFSPFKRYSLNHMTQDGEHAEKKKSLYEIHQNVPLNDIYM